jgi:hypothetical protein
MRRKVSILVSSAVALTALGAVAYAGDAKSDKHVWSPPVDVAQALNIKKETKATEALLKKAAEQCFDDACKQQVEECRKHLATCVIVPSKASVHEQEMENN